MIARGMTYLFCIVWAFTFYCNLFLANIIHKYLPMEWGMRGVEFIGSQNILYLHANPYKLSFIIWYNSMFAHNSSHNFQMNTIIVYLCFNNWTNEVWYKCIQKRKCREFYVSHMRMQSLVTFCTLHNISKPKSANGIWIYD